MFWFITFLIGTAFESEVRQAMAAGFDGVYLDWVDGFSEEHVEAVAKKEGIDPAKATVDFLLTVRKIAKSINPNALIVQQNAYGLLDEDERDVKAIDMLAVEDTWFSGDSNAKWGSKKAGDLKNKSLDEDSTTARLEQYHQFINAGIPVLTIDYCVDHANAQRVYQQAAKEGLIPLVTQVSLDRMTETPPPVLSGKMK